MCGAAFGASGFADGDAGGDDFGLDVTGGSPMFEVGPPSDDARAVFVERFLAQLAMQAQAVAGGRAGRGSDVVVDVTSPSPTARSAAQRRRQQRRCVRVLCVCVCMCVRVCGM